MKSRCRQVSVRLRVFAGYFCPFEGKNKNQFMLGLHFIPACILLLVCSLHFTPGPQSAVRSLRFTLTDIIICLELTLSFLIGRKRTVNFRNQRPGCHLAADYTIIVSRTLKVTGNHVMYDGGA